MTTVRMVAFLGMGSRDRSPFYDRTQYRLDGRESFVGQLCMRAVCDVYEAQGRAIETLHVVGTEEVEARWLGSIQEGGRPRQVPELSILGGELGRPAWFWRAPAGRERDERWELFDILGTLIDFQPIAKTEEAAAPDEILLDVTHGFRAQPFLGAASVSFLLSEWAREGVAAPPALRILYGGYDPNNPPAEGTLPDIWDLTEFITATRWNTALDGLMRHGRADDLHQLASLEAKSGVAAAIDAGVRGRDLAEASFPRKFGEVAQRFADDLATLRFESLTGTSAGELAELLDSSAMDDLVQRIPPLRRSVERLKQSVAPLQAESILTPEGIRAMGDLAKLYSRLQRFAEQAGVLREQLVTAYQLAEGGEDRPSGSGAPSETAAHLAAASRWAAFFRSTRDLDNADDSAHAAFGRCSDAVSKLRNDVLHGGLGKDARKAHKIRLDLERLTPQVQRVVDGVLQSGARGTERPGRLVNISNHPVEIWSHEQIEAARDLGHGDPTDLLAGMPLVPPVLDAEAVSKMADDIVEQARALSCSGAVVSTEYNLTWAILRRLWEAGIPCYVATTHRREDGAFRFVRWRRYEQ